MAATQAANMSDAEDIVTDEAQIPTPALIVDSQIVERNLARMSAYCRQHRLNLRPHAKTHKSLAMTRRQIAHGAIGISVAKIGEAEVLAEATPAVLVAYPCVEPRKAVRIAELAKRTAISVAVDSSLSIDVLANAAHSVGVLLGVLIDVDVGFHRTGVATAAQSLELARQVIKCPRLQLDGIFCFAGHVNGDAKTQTAQLTQISAMLSEVIDLWKCDRHEARIVSGGSTPAAYRSHLVPQCTEIRPGNYIYNDANGFHNNWCALEDCAASVAVTVVSTAVAGKCVIDAGSKTLSSDRLALNPDKGGFGYITELPEAKIVRLSEEHGEVDLSACPRQPQLGQRLHVVPNHLCPCVNLQDWYWLKLEGGRLERMQVEARGKLS